MRSCVPALLPNALLSCLNSRMGLNASLFPNLFYPQISPITSKHPINPPINFPYPNNPDNFEVCFKDKKFFLHSLIRPLEKPLIFTSKSTILSCLSNTSWGLPMMSTAQEKQATLLMRRFLWMKKWWKWWMWPCSRRAKGGFLSLFLLSLLIF